MTASGASVNADAALGRVGRSGVCSRHAAVDLSDEVDADFIELLVIDAQRLGRDQVLGRANLSVRGASH
jgi:hypothetical protein